MAGAKGSVTLEDGPRPYDSEKNNDTADITLDVTGADGGSGGSSSGGSSSASGNGSTGKSGATGGSSTGGKLRHRRGRAYDRIHGRRRSLR